MPKDRIKPLFDALSNGGVTEVRQVGELIEQEIQGEIAALNKEIKLVRNLVERYGGPSDGLSSSERSAKVREAALALAGQGRAVLTAQDVLDYLAEQGVEFDMKRPGSMVGTILSQMSEFRRLKQNQFQFNGAHDKEIE